MKRRSQRFSGHRLSRFSLADWLSDNKGMLIGAPMIALSLVVVAGTTMSTDNLRRDREVDPATLCSVSKPPSGLTLVLVDRTDPLAQENGPRFQQMMVGLGETALRAERLTIIPFADNLGAPLTPIFDVCSPGRRKDADAWTESGALMEKAYKDKFLAPLDEAIAQLSKPSKSDYSPITRQIERVTKDRTLTAVGGPAKIILLSDLLENTTEQSVYDSGPFELPPPRSQFLKGFTVQIVQLGNTRAAALQSPELTEKWVAWFRAAGATIDDAYLRPGEWNG